MPDRKRTTADELSTKIFEALDAAGIPRARWGGMEVVQGGVSIMLFGNGVEITYVDPSSESEHQTHVDRIRSVLIDQFDEKEVQLGNNTFRLAVTREKFALGDIKVYMYGVTGV